MAKKDASILSKFITPGKESQAESIANKGGYSLKPSGGGSNSSKSTQTIAPYQGTDTAGFINYLAQNNILTDNSATGISNANRVVNAAAIGTQQVPLTPKPLSNINPAGYMADYTNNLLQAQQQTQEQPQQQNDVGAVLSQYLDQPQRTDRQAIEEQAGVNQLAQQTRDTEAQINMINANNQAAIQAIRNQSAMEGGTVGILSAREDALNRSAATKLLPLTALYQAQIGNLNAAKEQVNTYIADENAYQERLYNWKKSIADKVYDQMTTQQKRQWDIQDQNLQMNLAQTKELNSVKGEMFSAAINSGQTDLARSIWNSTSIDEVYQKAANIQGGAAGGGLTPAQINSTVNSIAGAFDNEPIVKEYNTVKNYVNAFNSYGTSATDDQARIYAFAKIMDPNSVVRESEYKTVADYSQALLKRTGINVARVFTSTGVLSKEAREAMSKTLATKLTTQEGAYNQVRDEYQRQINDAYAGKARTITQYSAPSTETGDEELKQKVTSAGYDYLQMLKDGYSDFDIKEALNIK